jgi:hypothetical protein
MKFLSLFVFAQLASWNMGSPTNQSGSQITQNATSKASSIQSAILGRGAGILSAGSVGTMNANGWDANSLEDAISLNDYYEFTLTPTSGYYLNISSVDFVLRSYTANSPTDWALKSSKDNFVNVLASGVINPGVYIAIPFSNSVSITSFGPITFRLYVYYNEMPASYSGAFSIGPFNGNSIAVSGTALPVELSRFKAYSPDGRTAQLEWTTLTEIDNHYFAIERSADGREFREIGQVEGAGDAFHAIDYAFTDPQPASGINFYRLRQVDFDGAFSYSWAVSVVTEQDNDVTLSPQPAIAQMDIRLGRPFAADAWWRVYSLDGRLLKQGVISAETSIVPLDISTLSPGPYLLQVQAEREVFGLRFLKG